ncbi:MAG: DnaJ domain-containing protein [Gammaproteobacteria bacterium]|nr:DnaJ domain-containing protein [Gammaproteobacteria bacterium]
MKFKDYYDVMGLGRDATQDDIRRAYRKLARKFHPDVSKETDAEIRFKEIGEAYAVLKDPEKRSAYDQLGENWHAGDEFRPPPDWDAGFEFRGRGPGDRNASDFSDFFSSLFGEEFRQSGPHRGHAGFQARGEDHHAKVLIDVEDAYHGATRGIVLRTPELDGAGHLTARERTLNVKIPKGVKQGQRIRLSGQGAPGVGNGAAGDLYLEIEFKEHPLYRVDGRDVLLNLPITPWEAALGANVPVPTPDGPVSLTIPANTTSGRKLRLKARGIPGQPPGDLYAITQITVPEASSDAAKALYRKMEQELAYNPRSKLGV